MPTKGIATRLEAIELTKAGALDEGAAVGAYIGGLGGGNVYVTCASTDNVSPMVFTLYGAGADSVLVGVNSANTFSSAVTLYKMATGASKRFIVGAGWYVFIYSNSATTSAINIESYNCTLAQVDER